MIRSLAAANAYAQVRCIPRRHDRSRLSLERHDAIIPHWCSGCAVRSLTCGTQSTEDGSAAYASTTFLFTYAIGRGAAMKP